MRRCATLILLGYNVNASFSWIAAEPVFVKVLGAQESILPGWELIPGLLNRFTNTVRALASYAACAESQRL